MYECRKYFVMNSSRWKIYVTRQIMHEGKFIQEIRNTTHSFPLHSSSLNFLDDGSGESASVGENGRITEKRRRNKKEFGDSKKKNGENKTCQGNVFNFIMNHRIDLIFQMRINSFYRITRDIHPLFHFQIIFK